MCVALSDKRKEAVGSTELLYEGIVVCVSGLFQGPDYPWVETEIASAVSNVCDARKISSVQIYARGLGRQMI
jgi:hypothetical protein